MIVASAPLLTWWTVAWTEPDSLQHHHRLRTLSRNLPLNQEYVDKWSRLPRLWPCVYILSSNVCEC